jgi:hypothetical protein
MNAIGESIAGWLAVLGYCYEAGEAAGHAVAVWWLDRKIDWALFKQFPLDRGRRRMAREWYLKAGERRFRWKQHVGTRDR